MPFLTVGHENSNEIQIYFEDHGKGEAIVMIHGYPFSGLAWEKEAAVLIKRGYRVITYDRRGFGLSTKIGVGYDFDTFASDLNVLMNELNLREATLVGHSMGTGEITRYLSKYGSDRVKAGVLISPLQPFLLKTEDNKTGVDKKVFEGFQAAIQKDRYAFISDFLKNFYNLGLLNHNVSEEKLRADFNLASSASPTAFYECVGTWMTDFRQDLPKLNVPMLVIQGDKDAILPFEVTGKLLPNLINAELKVIKGASHGILWTHADEISEMIVEFVSKQQGKTAESVQMQ